MEKLKQDDEGPRSLITHEVQGQIIATATYSDLVSSGQIRRNYYRVFPLNALAQDILDWALKVDQQHWLFETVHIRLEDE